MRSSAARRPSPSSSRGSASAMTSIRPAPSVPHLSPASSRDRRPRDFNRTSSLSRTSVIFVSSRFRHCEKLQPGQFFQSLIRHFHEAETKSALRLRQQTEHARPPLKYKGWQFSFMARFPQSKIQIAEVVQSQPASPAPAYSRRRRRPQASGPQVSAVAPPVRGLPRRDSRPGPSAILETSYASMTEPSTGVPVIRPLAA